MKNLTCLMTVLFICVQIQATKLPEDELNKVQKTSTAQEKSDEQTNNQSFNKLKMLNGNFALGCQDTTAGSYVPYMKNYVYSPYIQVPSGDSVFFDFYIRGSFSDDYNSDYWLCQVSPDSGSNWYYISNPYGDTSGVNEKYINAPVEWDSFIQSYPPDGILNDYAGSTLRFRWYFRSDADTPEGEGIFLDDISLVVDGSTIFFEDFEDANMEDWETVDGNDMPGFWHQTIINSFNGQSWAMNDPDIGPQGGYDEHWYQTFDSPPVVLPSGQINTLTFMQYRIVEPPYNYPPWDGYDGTNIRISSDGGSSWTILNNANPPYNCSSLYSFGYEFDEGTGIPGWAGSSNGWEPVIVTIPSDYDGKEVIIRYAFASDIGYSTSQHPELIGWIIDDINIADILTNNGETNEGWVTESQVPLVGNYWNIVYVGSTSVGSNEQGDRSQPINYCLSQNYPNPFNPDTRISYQIPEFSFVTLKVYDLLGNEITTLISEIKSAGKYEVTFNANELASGIYFYQLKAGSFTDTKKMVLLF